jgi:pimeloyl-ACP methyl ester carboxylesterase
MGTGAAPQRIGYCTAPDGVRLAYAVLGEGAPLVRPSHWLTHLQHDLTNPVWRHVVLGLAHRRRLVRFDARGSGMSQRDVADISFERWVEDLEAVVDALGLERFALIGISQSASTAIEYAARHPERVSALIVYGGFARGPLLWGKDPEKARQRLDLTRQMIRAGWGLPGEAYRQFFTAMFVPGGTAEQYHAFNALQAASAKPEVADRHMAALGEIDVRHRLAQVAAPTLVLHCRGDAAVPMALGQEIAAGIPGAVFVPLDSPNHLALAGEPAHRQLLEAVARHLGEPPPRRALPGAGRAPGRVEATVQRLKANWLVELAAVVTTLAAAAALLWQLWRWAGG